MTGRIVHFEIPFDDGDRAKAFYGDVFGWQAQDMPEMQYTMVMTGPVGDNGMPRSLASSTAACSSARKRSTCRC